MERTHNSNRSENKQNTFLFRFIKGFIHRDKPLSPDNEEFIVFVRKTYILNLRYHVPKNVLDKSWLRPPGILENVRTSLRLMWQVTWALMEPLYFCSASLGLKGPP